MHDRLLTLLLDPLAASAVEGPLDACYQVESR